MDFESNEGYEHDFVYESEQKYFITYKNKINGASAVISGEAFSRCNAEELFNSKFYNCEIIKIQNRDEWINDIGEELAKGLMKHIKTLEGVVEKK
jgi:hypothetical protein